MTGRSLFTAAAAPAAAGDRAIETHAPGPYDTPCIPDLARCARLEIVVALNEHEQSDMLFQTWPEPVRIQVERHVNEWFERNPKARPVSVTTAVVQRTCVMVLHYNGG